MTHRDIDDGYTLQHDLLPDRDPTPPESPVEIDVGLVYHPETHTIVVDLEKAKLVHEAHQGPLARYSKLLDVSWRVARCIERDLSLSGCTVVIERVV